MYSEPTLIICSGTTGVNAEHAIRSVISELGKTSCEIIKLEKYLEEPYLLKLDLLAVSRNGVLTMFKKAFEEVKHRIKELIASNKSVVLVTHLTYFRRRHIIRNPIVEWLLMEQDEDISKTSKKLLILVEDYYHALLRIAERAKQQPIFQQIDPLAYLWWRGDELYTAITLGLVYSNKLNVYIMSVKHPKEVFKRLFEHMFNTKQYKLVYISHPISLPRRKCLSKNSSLHSEKFVKEVQEFKCKLIRRCPNIILLDPTTIDELIYEIQDHDEDLKVKIELRDRWPLFVEDLSPPHDYSTLFPVDLSDDSIFGVLYNPSSTVCQKWYRYEMRNLITSQIEVRDFMYVYQSDYVIAYRPTLEGALHRGVEAELRTAIAQAKPVFAYYADENERKAMGELFNFTIPFTDPERLIDYIYNLCTKDRNDIYR